MEMAQIHKETRARMDKAVEALEHHLGVLRTGRANPGILKKIVVDYYGSTMPLDQVATISAPDARTLMVSPWDRGALGPIEKAIRDSDLGLNPNNKGDTVFISLPMLTEERRKELVKTARTYGEEGRVAVRNARKHAMDELKRLDGVSEDDLRRAEAEVQKITDEYTARVDDVLTRKEQDILG